MKDRVIYLDILNIVACFAVLCLHHNGIVHSYNVNTLAWRQALAFEVLFYWAVPVFFMLTGATLIPYRERCSTKAFFLKRIQRSLVPFLGWSCILFFLSLYQKNIIAVSFTQFIESIINTKLRYGDIYWFFIPLFAIYLTIPILSLFHSAKNRYWIFWYIVACSFITFSCLPLLVAVIGVNYNWAFGFPLNGGGYIIFVCLGYLLANIDLSKDKRILIYLLGIGSALFRYSLTYYLSLETGHVEKLLFSYTQFHSVLLAAAVFVFVKNCDVLKSNIVYKHVNLITKISSCSLGIYLIHRLIMRFLEIYVFVSSDNVYFRFFGMFLTYAVGLLVVLILKKIPVIKTIVP